jgi:hypothetical protein
LIACNAKNNQENILYYLIPTKKIINILCRRGGRLVVCGEGNGGDSIRCSVALLVAATTLMVVMMMAATQRNKGGRGTRE